MLRRDKEPLRRLRHRLGRPGTTPDTAAPGTAAPGAATPTRDTRPEQAVAALLERLGVAYEAQYRLLPNVTVDFFLPAHDLVIECQGTWFHADPTRYGPGELRRFQQRKVAHDAALRRWCARAGLRLLALWEEELAREPERCEQRLRAALHGASPGNEAMSQLVRRIELAGGVILSLHHGDLTTEPVTAIVNAANGHLSHGGGVAGAIVRRGGRVIQEESDAWVRAHGPVPTGQVALTGAGDLAARAVIHAVGPIWHGGTRGEPGDLRAAVVNSLALAHDQGFESVALPAISSGVFGFPKEQCAEILVATAVEFAATHPHGPLREIRFTNYDQTTLDLFAAEFTRRFGQG